MFMQIDLENSDQKDKHDEPLFYGDELKTRLLDACLDGNDEDVIHLVNKYPELVNSCDEYGYTVLILASGECEPATLELLISLGADVQAVGKYSNGTLIEPPLIG